MLFRAKKFLLFFTILLMNDYARRVVLFPPPQHVEMRGPQGVAKKHHFLFARSFVGLRRRRRLTKN